MHLQKLHILNIPELDKIIIEIKDYFNFDVHYINEKKDSLIPDIILKFGKIAFAYAGSSVTIKNFKFLVSLYLIINKFDK